MKHYRAAFITGGSSGIGRQLSERLLAAGTSVAVIDRHHDANVLRELQRKAETAGNGRCEFFQADVTDASAVQDAVKAAVDSLGAPDLAINCAGIQNAKPFAELTAQEFEQVVNVNLFGSRNFAAATLPHMTSGGQLALVASLAGLVSNFSYSAYNASKHGVVGLAGALRLEYLARGVEVSVICPPEINTPMVVEERKTLHDAGARLKDAAGSLELAPACDYMLKQLSKGQYMIIPGTRARGISALARWLPNLMRTFSERMVAASLAS